MLIKYYLELFLLMYKDLPLLDRVLLICVIFFNLLVAYYIFKYYLDPFCFTDLAGRGKFQYQPLSKQERIIKRWILFFEEEERLRKQLEISWSFEVYFKDVRNLPEK